MQAHAAALERDRSAQREARHGFEEELEVLLQTNKLLTQELQSLAQPPAKEAAAEAAPQVGRSFNLNHFWACMWMVE